MAFIVCPLRGSLTADEQTQKPKTSQGNERVMSPGMTIAATTRSGTITITALDDLTRSYSWEGATRSVEMARRTKRWYGSLGLYYPGPGNHWKEHKGITRGVVEEGQQHFKATEEALEWIRSQTWQPYVYRDDGLMIGWSKTLPRQQLNVEVWQIYIDGKKPQRLPGSKNKMITVTTTTSVPVCPTLVETVAKNEVAAVRELLGKGANPNVCNKAGIPVLIVAAKQGYAPIVEALLSKGANPNVKGLQGTTALIEAAIGRHVETIRLLLAKGADVNAAYDAGMLQGVTALNMAAWDGDEVIVSTLLDAGATVDAQDTDGNTAIHKAASAGHSGIVELLLKKGASVDSRDWLGTTPLMAAAMESHSETVRLLVDKGADVNARDDKTRRLYRQAAFTGNRQIQEQLKKSGQLEVRRDDGASVLDYAKIGGDEEIIELLKQAGAEE